ARRDNERECFASGTRARYANLASGTLNARRATSSRGTRLGVDETSTNRQLDKALAHGPNGSLRAVGDADLSQDVLDVFLDRFVTDMQRQGDFLVGQTERQLPQDFAFALRERHLDIGNQPRRGERAGDATQCVAGPRVFTRNGGANGIEQFVAAGAFEQVAGGSQ